MAENTVRPIQAETGQVPDRILNDFDVVAEAIRSSGAGDEALLALAGIAQYVGDQLEVQATLEVRAADAEMRATTDVLTGLANKRALLARDSELTLHRRFTGAEGAKQRQSQATGRWTGYVDLDKFKPINDTLGHKQGDRTLSLFAYALRLSTRPEDELYRIGGDEFVVYMAIDRGVSEDFHDQIDRRLHASMRFLLTDDGAEYLQRSGFGRLTEVDRVVLADLIGWTTGGYYTEDPSISRVEAMDEADKHMNSRKAAKGSTR